MRFILKTIIDAIGLMLIAGLLAPNFYVEGFVVAFFAAILLSFVNSIIRPIVNILSIPITIITFGLFILVINGFMFMIVSAFFGASFGFTSFWYAILVAILFSLYHWVVDRIVGT